MSWLESFRLLDSSKLNIHPVACYLMSCYAYEILSDSFLTDFGFDKLGVFIQEHWDEIDHPHKKYIDREACHCTSALTVQYYELPLVVLTATHEILGTSFKVSPIFDKAMGQLALREFL